MEVVGDDECGMLITAAGFGLRLFVAGARIAITDAVKQQSQRHRRCWSRMGSWKRSSEVTVMIYR